MRNILLTLPFTLLTLSAFAQQRMIVGDTAFWYRWHMPFIENARLSDFSTNPAPFSLRFTDHNQVIEIHQYDGVSRGTLTNFTYWTGRKGADHN